MSFLGLLVALLAGLMIWMRWSPLERPAQRPGADPVQMLERGKEAAEEFRALQEERQQKLERQLLP